MSLILEALRKSEAERRRGLPPDLAAELPPAPPPGRRTARAWLLLPALAIVVVAGWLLGRDPAGPRVAATPAGVRTPAPAPPATAAAPVAPEPALPAPTPVPPAVPAPASAPGGSPPSPPTATTATTPDPGGSAAAATPPAPAHTHGADTGETPHAAAPPATPAGAAPASAPPASTDGGRVLALPDLDSGTRQALPPLKLSMHLWNEAPARRFVILDGQRLGEGDRIGEARVVRIERDGVLLEWQGRGIRLPVR